MKYFGLTLFLLFLVSIQTSAQTYQQKLDSIKKYHLIYATKFETQSTTTYYSQSSGAYKGKTSARGISIDFHQGIDGPLKTLKKKGKYLKQIIQNDPDALAEFNRAYKVHLRKKRICNFIEFFGYAVVAGSAIALFIGLDNYETDGVTAPVVIGGTGVVAGFTGIVVFKKLTDKHMDAFAASIQNSISIYNENLLNKIK